MEEKFNIVKKGYDPSEVDAYIDELEAIVKSYKGKDSAIKNAIISAEIASENIVKNAENEADKIVRNAENEAAQIKVEAVRFLDDVLESVANHKDYINSFRQEYKAMIQRYTDHFEEGDIFQLITNAGGVESYVSEVRASALSKAAVGEDLSISDE